MPMPGFWATARECHGVAGAGCPMVSLCLWGDVRVADRAGGPPKMLQGVQKRVK